MAAGFTSFLALGVLLAQTFRSFSAGQVISASEINDNFKVAAPEGAVMAFYLTTCPSGWIPADGTNSTPDLRGAFVRGLNSFDGGTTSNARDPQDTGARSIGHFQTDAFQGHRHGYSSGGDAPTIIQPVANGSVTTGGPGSNGLLETETTTITDQGQGTPRFTTETRPQNVALIYCVRRN